MEEHQIQRIAKCKTILIQTLQKINAFKTWDEWRSFLDFESGDQTNYPDFEWTFENIASYLKIDTAIEKLISKRKTNTGTIMVKYQHFDGIIPLLEQIPGLIKIISEPKGEKID